MKFSEARGIFEGLTLVTIEGTTIRIQQVIRMSSPEGQYLAVMVLKEGKVMPETMRIRDLLKIAKG